MPPRCGLATPRGRGQSRATTAAGRAAPRLREAAGRATAGEAPQDIPPPIPIIKRKTAPAAAVPDGAPQLFRQPAQIPTPKNVRFAAV